MEIIISFLVLLSIALFFAIVYRRRLRSKFWWKLNRVRAMVAYEGDPGPWVDK